MAVGKGISFFSLYILLFLQSSPFFPWCFLPPYLTSFQLSFFFFVVVLAFPASAYGEDIFLFFLPGLRVCLKNLFPQMGVWYLFFSISHLTSVE